MTQLNQTNGVSAQQSFGALHLAARQRKQKGGAVLPVLVALVVGYLLVKFLGWQLVLAAVAGIVLFFALILGIKLAAVVAAVVAVAALLAHCHKDEAPKAPPVVQQQQAPAPAQAQAQQKPASKPGSAEDVDTMAEGGTALMRAAINGRFDSVKDLVERGANVNKRAENGKTPLTFAAANGHLNIVKFLVEHGANAVVAPDSDGYTPIEWAAKQGHAPIVKYLLENTDVKKLQGFMVRALIGTIDEFYWSTGHSRREKSIEKLSPSFMEIAHLLIDAGTPVMAYVGGSYDAQAPWKKYNRASPWSRAWTVWAAFRTESITFSKSSSAKLIQYMVAHGADVNAELDWIAGRFTGKTHPIMLAAMRRDVDMVKLLLDAGAQVNVRATGALDTPSPWNSGKPTSNWIQGLTPLGKLYREMDALLREKCGGHKERLCCIDGKCEGEKQQQELDDWKAIETMLKAAGAHE